MTTDSIHGSEREIPGDPIITRDLHIARLRRDVDELTGSAEILAVRDAEVATLRARLDAVLAARRRDIERLERRVADLESMLADAARAARHADELEAALVDAQERIRAAEAAAQRAADAAAESARSQGAANPGEAMARIAALEAALAGRPVPAPAPGYGDSDAAFRHRLDDRIAVWKRLFERRIAQQSEALDEKERIIARLLREEDEDADVDPNDLTQINGIGTVIASTLNSLGYAHLDDIAALQPEDLHDIDDALGVFRGRAERDRWVDQARELLRRSTRHIGQARPEQGR